MDQNDTTIDLFFDVRRWVECRASDKVAFCARVAAGGAVEEHHVKAGAANAEQLVFALSAGLVVGTAALKNPRDAYRARVFRDARAGGSAEDYSFEVGYVWVDDRYRGRQLSLKLLAHAMSGYEHARIFATTGSEAMMKSLERTGFSQVGSPYTGRNGQLSLFLYAGR